MKRLLYSLISLILTATMLCSCASELEVVPTSDEKGSSELTTMYAKEDTGLFSTPNSGVPNTGTLKKGEAAKIISFEDGWYRIKTKDGEFYVQKEYLTKDKPSEAGSDKETEVPEEKWVAAWGTAMLTAGAEQIPSAPALKENTVRQQIRTSISGNTLRLVLSNEYGETDLEIESLKIAKIPDPKKPDIDLDTECEITVNGKSSFVIAHGEKIMTDSANFEFSALEDIAVTMKLGSVPKTITCHTASRCSAWVQEGSHVSDNDYKKYHEMTAWYFLAEMDTLASEDTSVLICLGDSLTDGASVTTNGFSTYPQELSRLLQNDGHTNISAINMGIGATALYIYGGDIAGTNRANRDVLKVPGVKYCVLLMGVNDIGAAQNDISQDIINEYKSLIERCHDNDIKIFGCTLTPFKGNAYYSDLHEKIRKKVNEFVLSDSSGFDGVIDLASAVASSDDSDKMDRKYVSVWNDYLHFNDDGYKYVAQTIYENIKDKLE